MKQTLVIQGWLPEQVANSHLSPFVLRKRLKQAQITAWASAKQAGWERITCRARLSITLVFPVQRRRDADNLHSRVKGVIDGLKEWFIDDSTDWLELHVTAAVEKGVRETRVELEPAE